MRLDDFEFNWKIDNVPHRVTGWPAACITFVIIFFLLFGVVSFLIFIVSLL